MKLKPVDDTIVICQGHLGATGCRGTQIDIFLANYLAVQIHSAFQQEIERLLENRANHVGDPALREFMISCVNAIFRSTRISEIAGLLSRFGDKYKEMFKNEMQIQPRASTSWDSIVSHRHGIAHGSGNP